VTSLDGVGSLAGRKVAIVEDEVLLAMEEREVLEEAGCEVIGPFPTCERALAALDRTRPDAVLLDLNLNGQTTETVARALAERGIPFVVVTGYSRSFLKDPVFQGIPVVAKPFSEYSLLAGLAKALA
jgi:AmiR/NasT family two-component response regulator